MQYTMFLKPNARTLTIFYAIAAFIILSFGVLLVIGLLELTDRIAISIWLCSGGFLGGLGIAGIVAWIHLEMLSSHYEVTENHAEAHWGLLFKRNDVIQLGAVRSVTVRQNPVQRIFNTGDLILRATGHSTLVMWDVSEPEAKRKAIWELVTQVSPVARSRY